jgi:hypothetical protein
MTLVRSVAGRPAAVKSGRLKYEGHPGPDGLHHVDSNAGAQYHIL